LRPSASESSRRIVLLRKVRFDFVSAFEALSPNLILFPCFLRLKFENAPVLLIA
jgi:hypothetical protein